MESRLEKRIKSIRSLPQGQFSKYRQMFDSLMRTKCKEIINRRSIPSEASNGEHGAEGGAECGRSVSICTQQTLNDTILEGSVDADEEDDDDEDEYVNKSMLIYPNERNILELPYTDDEKSKHLFMENSSSGSSSSSSGNNSETNSKLFEGVSDETSNVLNSLCSSIKQIAEFFEKPANDTTYLSESSNSSLHSASSSQINSNPATSMSLFKAVPVNTTNQVVEQPISQAQQAVQTVCQPNETVVTYIIENDSYRDDEDDNRAAQVVKMRPDLSKIGNKKNNRLVDDTKSYTSSLSSSFSYSRNSNNTDGHKLAFNTKSDLFSSTISTILTSNNYETNYFELDDVDFSDDSYENENDTDFMQRSSRDDQDTAAAVVGNNDHDDTGATENNHGDDNEIEENLDLQINMSNTNSEILVEPPNAEKLPGIQLNYRLKK